jgi:hypothetical protein
VRFSHPDRCSCPLFNSIASVTVESNLRACFPRINLLPFHPLASCRCSEFIRFLVLYLRPSVLPDLRCLLSYCAFPFRPLLSYFVTFVSFVVYSVTRSLSLPVHFSHLCVTSKFVDFCQFFVRPCSLIRCFLISVVIFLALF